MYAEKRAVKSSNPVLGRWRAPHPVAHDPSSTVTILRKDPENTYDAGAGRPVQVAGEAMTMDDVVVRSAMTLGTVILTAVLSWILLPVDDMQLGRSYGIAGGAALLAFAASLAQTFRSRPSPPLILAYAAFEGVFLGVLSAAVSTHIAPGVAVQAVLGTMAVFAGVLIAYRAGWIRVTHRFSGFLIAAGLGYLLLTASNLLFSALSDGEGLGFRSGGLGIAFGLVGVVLATAFLALHFKQVEDGIAHGAPRSESWLAAFGLTLTLVWLYVEILNLLTLVHEEDVL
ncbi:Bax inhibitor-1/YccA family protein [Streptomyces phaeoluteigriseus]